jgi:HEAT repeat protein
VLAEDIFVRCLREDRFFGVRAASATALGKLGSRAWAAPLRQAAQSDPDLQVRHEASEALRAIGAEEAR